MRFVAPRKALRNSLALVLGAVPAKGTFPDRAALVRADGALTVAAWDDEVAVAVPVNGADIDTGGTFLVDADPLVGRLAGENDWVAAGAGAGLFVLDIKNLSDALRFRAQPDSRDVRSPTSKPTLTVPAPALRRALARVLLAARRDDTDKLVLSGCRWAFARGRLELVCTDGDRIARLVIDAEGRAPAKTVVPARALRLLEKLLGPGDVRVWLDGDAVYLEASGGLVRTKPKDLKLFPPFEKVIPRPGPRAQVRADQLAGAAKQACGSFVTLDLAAGQLLVRPDENSPAVVVPVKYKGKPAAIEVNAGHLADGLGKLSAATVGLQVATVEIKSKGKRLVTVAACDYDGGDGLYLVVGKE